MDLKSAIRKIHDQTVRLTEFRDVLYNSGLIEMSALPKEGELDLHEVDFYKTVDLSSNSVSDTYEQTSSGRKVELIEIMEDFKVGHICFVGPAGIGKSTLLRSISRDIFYKNFQSLNGVELLYLQCNNHDSRRRISVEEFLFNSLSLNKTEVSAAMKMMRLKPQKFVIVLDSLDTLRYTIDDHHDSINLEDEAYPGEILSNLLSGNLLQGCRFITSARDHAIRNLKGKARPSKVIAISGFSEESMKNTLNGYLGESEAKKFLQYIEENAPSLRSICNIPVMLLYTVLSFRCDSNFKPSTATGCLGNVLQYIIRSQHAHQGRNIMTSLEKLEELSHRGNLEHKVSFSVEDMKTVGLDEEGASDLSIFAPGGSKSKCSNNNMLYFPHQTLQEMLGAVKIAKMNFEDFKAVVDNFLHLPRFANVRKFVCGLELDDEVHSMLSRDILDREREYQSKAEYLLSSLAFQLQRNMSSRDLLELFASLAESKSKAAKIVNQHLKSVNFHTIKLLKSDVHVIGTVLAWGSQVNSFQITSCGLDEAKIKLLNDLIKNSFLKIDSFMLNDERTLGTEGVEYAGKIASQCDVKKFGLAFCNLSPEQAKVLSHSLSNLKMLKQLFLDGNTNLGEKGIMTAGEITIHHVLDRLDLDRCRLTAKEIQALAISLRGAKKLRSIHMEDERIVTAEYIKPLANLVRSINERLWLVFWRFEQGLLNAFQDELDKIGEKCASVFLTYQDSISGRSKTQASREEDVNLNTTLEAVRIKIENNILPEDFYRSENVYTAEHVFGPGGGTLSLNSCSITYEEGIIPEQLPAFLSMTFGERNPSTGLIPVTPIFSVNLKDDISAPVVVRLPTWLESQKHITKIYRRQRSGKDFQWSNVECGILHEKEYIEFKMDTSFEVIGLVQSFQSDDVLNLHHTLANLGRKFASVLSYYTPDNILISEMQSKLMKHGYSIVSNNRTAVCCGDLEFKVKLVSMQSDMYHFFPFTKIFKISSLEESHEHAQYFSFLLKYLEAPKSTKVDLRYEVGYDSWKFSADIPLENFTKKAIENILRSEDNSTTKLSVTQCLSGIGRDDKTGFRQKVSKKILQGTISNDDGAIVFNEGCFQQAVQIQMETVMPDSIDIDDELLPASPILRLSPCMELGAPAEVSLATWIRADENRNALVYYRRAKNQAWQYYSDTGIDRSGRCEFSISNFCEYFLCIKAYLPWTFMINSWLYCNEKTKKLTNRLFWGCTTCEKKVSEKMSEKGFTRTDCSIDPCLTTKLGDKISVTIEDVRGENIGQTTLPTKTAEVTYKFLKGNENPLQEFLFPMEAYGLVQFRHKVVQNRNGENLPCENYHPADRVSLEKPKELHIDTLIL